MDEWLKNIKAGDRVIVHRGHYSREIKKVVRMTKTLIIIGEQHVPIRETKYRRADGYRSGHSQWNRGHISEATPEQVDLVNEINRRTNLIYKIGKTNLTKLPTTKLEEIYAIIAES